MRSPIAIRYTYVCLCVLGACAPAVPAPARPGTARVPANAPPVISITHRDPAYRRPELRLASFITALQTGNRQRAVRLFSVRVGPTARRDFLAGRWLRRDTARRTDFSQILFMRDIQIRPRTKIAGDRLVLQIVPRDIPWDKKNKRHLLLGSLDVPMRRESGDWFVELQPGRI